MLAPPPPPPTYLLHLSRAFIVHFEPKTSFRKQIKCHQAIPLLLCLRFPPNLRPLRPLTSLFLPLQSQEPPLLRSLLLILLLLLLLLTPHPLPSCPRIAHHPHPAILLHFPPVLLHCRPPPITYPHCSPPPPPPSLSPASTPPPPTPPHSYPPSSPSYPFSSSLQPPFHSSSPSVNTATLQRCCRCLPL
jgi:hypothetical protein